MTACKAPGHPWKGKRPLILGAPSGPVCLGGVPITHWEGHRIPDIHCPPPHTQGKLCLIQTPPLVPFQRNAFPLCFTVVCAIYQSKVFHTSSQCKETPGIPQECQAKVSFCLFPHSDSSICLQPLGHGHVAARSKPEIPAKQDHCPKPKCFSVPLLLSKQAVWLHLWPLVVWFTGLRTRTQSEPRQKVPERGGGADGGCRNGMASWCPGNLGQPRRPPLSPLAILPCPASSISSPQPCNLSLSPQCLEPHSKSSLSIPSLWLVCGRKMCLPLCSLGPFWKWFVAVTSTVEHSD